MIRHAVRQFAVQTLYQIEVGQMSREEAIHNIKLMIEELKEEAIQYFADEITHQQLLQIEEQFKLDEFYFKLIDGVLTNLSVIDQMIEANLEGWNLNRLNKVDKAIIRLATYEMLFNKQIPNEVVINEALELTKEFSESDGAKARSFNNKVLDQINKQGI